MYYLKDLSNGRLTGFETPQSLARWWTVHQDINDFSNLNVTGKDTVTIREYYGSILLPDDTVLPQYRIHIYMRRYQVLDSMGRSINIRTWPAAYFTTETERRRYVCTYTGAKQKRHRAKGPSLQFRLMKQAEPELNGIRPIRDKTGMRKKTIMSPEDWWNYYEYQHFKSYTRPRSWKSQTKSERQWSKSRTRRPKQAILPEPGDDLARRLTIELILNKEVLP